MFASSTSVETRIVYWRALLSFGLAKDIKIFTKIFTNLELKISTQLTAESLKNILENTSEIIQQVSTISEAEMIVIQQQILEAFSNKKTIEKNAIEKKENEAYITKVEDVIFSEEKEIYVSNAGLILLHPFLESLFKKLNYLENGLLNKSSWEEATHVLHYLATKQEQPHEHALLFPKYLCGIAQNTPIYKFQQLSEATKAECENVLQAVLHYWPGLKTNSADILRTEFLTREGKLTLTSDLEKLYIQRKAQDILLDNIPWTIGIAKLPWKKQLIYTEW